MFADECQILHNRMIIVSYDVFISHITSTPQITHRHHHHPHHRTDRLQISRAARCINGHSPPQITTNYIGLSHSSGWDHLGQFKTNNQTNYPSQQHTQNLIYLMVKKNRE